MPAILALLFSASGEVQAHASDMGFVQLLPTTYYMVGGTLAVAASFLVFAMMRPRVLEIFRRFGFDWRLPGARVANKLDTREFRPRLRHPASWLGFLFLVLLLCAGFTGSSDPLANPLPLTAWTLFWVLLTILHAKLGNVWRLINPWSGPAALANSILGGSKLRLPVSVGYWPAILTFIAFAWFELVSLAPEDPRLLAKVLSGYWLLHFMAILLFGERRWLTVGEPFSVFFRFISLLSAFTRRQRSTNSMTLRLGLPGYRLLQEPSPGLTGALFVLVTLATVSFDGLNKTFWWLALNNINPLAFEGRSSVTSINSIGLLGVIAVLVSLYFFCVWLGWKLSGERVSLNHMLGLTALAIMPISLAYHFSHYLTQLLVNGQYAIAAFNDPFSRGWHLLGLKHFHVTTSFLSNHAMVEIIWKLQVAVIVGGHIFSVALAHLLALRLLHESNAAQHQQTERQFALRSQLPLGVLMIAYTLFGLWLISTPTGA